jgi:hypothetical protein
MSKVDEALVLELKNGKNTNVVPLTKYNISEESWTKRGSRRINSTISNHDDHPNFVSILKDDNLIPIPEITSLKFHHAKPEKKSKRRKDYEAVADLELFSLGCQNCMKYILSCLKKRSKLLTRSVVYFP